MLRNNFSFVYVKLYMRCFIQSDGRKNEAFWLVHSFCFEIFHKTISVTIAIAIVIHIAILVDRCYFIFTIIPSKNCIFSKIIISKGSPTSEVFEEYFFYQFINFEFRAMSFMAPHFHGIMVYPLSEPTKESDFQIKAHFFLGF